MTDVHTLEKNGSGESRGWHNPLSLPLNLRGRRWGLWTLALFFFLLPLQTRYFLREAPLYEWGTVSVFLVEIIGWIVVGLGLLRYTEIRSPKLRRSDLLFFVLPFLAFISIIWATDKVVATQSAVRLVEGVLLYFVILFYTTPNPSSPRRGNTIVSSPARGEVRRGGSEWIIWAFLGGAALQAGLGIYQFLTQSSFASTLFGMALHDPRELGTSVVQFADERWLRAYGGLPHPNVLGGYLVVALAVWLGIWRGRASGRPEARPPYIAFAIAPILLTGIFFTFSRVAWLAAAVILIGLIGRIRPIRPIGLIFAGWIVVLSIIYWPLVSTRLNLKSAERLEVKARVERVEGVREAWEIIKRHPVRGVGIGNYTQSVARELRPGQPLWSYQPVHSVPLLVWAELGTIGLILFVGVLWKVATHIRPVRDRGRSPRPISNGIRERSLAPTVASGLGMTTLGLLLLLDHYLWTLPFGILLFWAILGLSTALKQEGLDKNPAL